MKIGIDISQVIYETGVSTYTRNLVTNLLKIDKENEYILFAGTLRRKKDFLNIFPQSKVVPFPPTLSDLIWNKLHIFPVEKMIGDINIFHSSDWSEPPSKAFKVTTVHDLYALKFPKLVEPHILDVHKRKLAWVIKESKRIITPSISTKGDLVEIGVNPDIIRVIPEAPTFSKASEEDVQGVKRKFQIQGDYLMAIGVTPLKNTERIIKAFHLSSAGRDLKLVVAGRPINLTPKEERNIRFLGHVSKNELAALLTGSSGLIFASIYEGFGIPILDAFNCDVPVVTSTTASMPEVAGNAAALVDPLNVNSIAEGIVKIVRGKKGFVERGRKRVKEFSWEKNALDTLSVYKEAKL